MRSGYQRDSGLVPAFETMKYRVEDKRPVTPAEARKGMEELRSWPEKDRLEIFELPDNEAAIVLLLAGELGAVPETEEEETPHPSQ